MKAKESEAVKKITHPISVFSNNPHFVSSISFHDKEYIAEIPAKALFVQIDEETF